MAEQVMTGDALVDAARLALGALAGLKQAGGASAPPALDKVIAGLGAALGECVNGDLVTSDDSMGAAARMFVALERQRFALEARLEDLKRETARLGGPDGTLTQMMVESGIKHMRLDGRTIWLDRKVWAFRADEATVEQVHEALRRAHLGFLVRLGYSASQLAAVVRERIEAGREPLTPGLARVLKIEERVQLKSRRTS